MQPNPSTAPDDLRNLGVKCHDCKGAGVVYYIAVPDPAFALGGYCYPCLLACTRATIRQSPRGPMYHIPMPMEWNLLGRLKVDLGMEKPSQIPAF